MSTKNETGADKFIRAGSERARADNEVAILNIAATPASLKRAFNVQFNAIVRARDRSISSYRASACRGSLGSTYIRKLSDIKVKYTSHSRAREPNHDRPSSYVTCAGARCE